MEDGMEYQFYNPALLSLTKIRDRGANSGNVRNQNRRLILKLIKDAGVISRKDLVKKTGLKLATITMAINDLLQMGMISKAGLMDGDSGRRIMGFSFASNEFCTITIRLSTSYLKIGAYDVDNNNLSIKKIFMDTLRNIDQTCEVIVREVGEITQVLGKRKILGVGVGVEGPFIMKNGYYNLPHPQSEDGYFDIGKVLFEKLGYPILVNKANNFGVYNLWKTDRSPHQLGIYVYISVSYTIECGIMINGEIIHGSDGSAGLVGKILIGQDNMGYAVHLQDEASTNSVVKRALALLDQYPNSVLVLKKDDLNIRDIIRGFTMEDDLAVAVFTDVGVQLGRMVADLINILNPDSIFIGDEIPQTERMKDIIEKEARRHISKGVNPNLHLEVLGFASARDTKRDPSLIGASNYIFDAFIQSIDFGE
jgi:N-acetylglucosamine repressor